MADRVDRGGARRVQLASGLNILVAIWLFISPWILTYTDEAGWNSTITAAVIAALAAIRVAGLYSAAWLSWLNVALGIWLVIAPWVLSYEDDEARTNSVIVGIIVGLIATWSAVSSPRAAPPTA